MFSQLFTIGIQKLNTDGTLMLDANDKPIPTYDNTDIQNFARSWTGFDRREVRGNTEMNEEQKNNLDPMELQGPYRDYFPKFGLDGTYIGDTYPLCVDEPDKAFLKKGATYRLLGSSSIPTVHYQPNSWTGSKLEDFRVFSLSSQSELFSELCNGSPGNCNFRTTVTLNRNLDCSINDPECAVDDLRLVEIQSTPYPVRYEYIRPPCVEFAFYENGKTIQERNDNAMCGNSALSIARDTCCEFPNRVSPRASSFCKYSGERTTFNTSKARCENESSLNSGRDNCAFYGIKNINRECHLFSLDEWYWAGEEPCILQARGKIPWQFYVFIYCGRLTLLI